EDEPLVVTRDEPQDRGGMRDAREYDLYLPLQYGDGTAVEPEKIAALQKRLLDRFGGPLFYFDQPVEGIWSLGATPSVGETVMLRVFAEESEQSREYFSQLKTELMADLRHTDIVIVEKKVKLL